MYIYIYMSNNILSYCKMMFELLRKRRPRNTARLGMRSVPQLGAHAVKKTAVETLNPKSYRFRV